MGNCERTAEKEASIELCCFHCFRWTAIGPAGGNCSISALQRMANRSWPTSKMIFSRITSAAVGDFGNSMTRGTVRGPPFAAPLSSGWLLFLLVSFRTTTGRRFLPFRELAIDVVTIPDLR